MPWRTQIRAVWQWLGPGNTNLRLGTPAGYYPSPTTRYTAPRTPPPAGAVPGLPRGTGHQEHAHMTSLGLAKEILGVENAQETGALQGCVPAGATLRPAAVSPLQLALVP